MFERVVSRQQADRRRQPCFRFDDKAVDDVFIPSHEERVVLADRVFNVETQQIFVSRGRAAADLFIVD